MSGEFEPELVLARRILLDALEALASQRGAVVLVGAQAIYLRVGDVDIAVAPFTTDGDIAIDPELLGDDPNLAQVMEEADFDQRSQPGMWYSPEGVRIDLMVPAALGGRPGRRGADLGGHGQRVARQARGLECALFDNSIMDLGSLDADDPRTFSVRVAGPAALVIAKAHKLSDRQSDMDRLAAKDALDVLRLLRGSSIDDMASMLKRLAESELAAEVTREGLDMLSSLFSRPDAVGSTLAAEATKGVEDPDTIAQSCAELCSDLLARLSP